MSVRTLLYFFRVWSFLALFCFDICPLAVALLLLMHAQLLCSVDPISGWVNDPMASPLGMVRRTVQPLFPCKYTALNSFGKQNIDYSTCSQEKADTKRLNILLVWFLNEKLCSLEHGNCSCFTTYINWDKLFAKSRLFYQQDLLTHLLAFNFIVWSNDMCRFMLMRFWNICAAFYDYYFAKMNFLVFINGDV